MTLAELAGYLHMSKRTVLKLAGAKKVPGVLIDKEWRFRRGDVDAWLEGQLEGESTDFEEIRDGMQVPLGDLMPPEAIVHDMVATDALSAIEELAATAYGHKWLNDKPWFVGALVEREALASTAMEGGVAFLHTRSRDTGKIRQPFVLCGRSYPGIDFGSPDGRPTYLFFLLGLKYDRLHLPILGRLARLMMRNPTVINRLRATTSPMKMRDVLLKLDAQELSTGVAAPAVYRPKPGPKLDRKDRLRTIMKVNARHKYEEKKADKESRKLAKKAKAAEAKKKASASRAVEKKAAAAGKASAAKKAAAATAAAKSSKSTTAKAAAKKPTATKPTTRKPAAKKSASTTTTKKSK